MFEKGTLPSQVSTLWKRFKQNGSGFKWYKEKSFSLTSSLTSAKEHWEDWCLTTEMHKRSNTQNYTYIGRWSYTNWRIIVVTSNIYALYMFLFSGIWGKRYLGLVKYAVFRFAGDSLNILGNSSRKVCGFVSSSHARLSTVRNNAEQLFQG